MCAILYWSTPGLTPTDKHSVKNMVRFFRSEKVREREFSVTCEAHAGYYKYLCFAEVSVKSGLEPTQ